MASSVESIISILELFFGMLIYFGIPALLFLISFAVAVIVVTRVGSSILTAVFTRFPTVARPLNYLTKTVASVSRHVSFERARLVVVVCLSLLYAMVYIPAAWVVFAVYEAIGEAIFTTSPEWYMRTTQYSYPLVALLFGLLVILVIYILREPWRESASVSRTVFEWGIVLFTLNVLVPAGLFAVVVGSGALGQLLGELYIQLIEAVSRSFL